MAHAPFTVKANYAYQARSDNEASLIAGQQYTVLQTDGGANVWWNIKDHTGKVGWIPANYATPVTESAAPPAPPAKAGPTATTPAATTPQPKPTTPTQTSQPAIKSPVAASPATAQPANAHPQSGMIQTDPNRTKVQLVVVGDGAVGKTCALVSYCTGNYPTEYIPTVFETYCVQLTVDGKDIDLILMDTAGQEDYDKIRPLSYNSTDVFLIMYSVVLPASFDNVKAKWVGEVTHYCPGTPIILVGTKMDLRDDPKTLSSLRGSPISFDDGLQLSTELSRDLGQRVLFMECSACTRQGLPEVFQKAVQQALNVAQAKKDTAVSTGHGSRCVLL